MTVIKTIRVDCATLDVICHSCIDDLPTNWCAESDDSMAWKKDEFTVLHYNFNKSLQPAYKKKIGNMIPLGLVSNKKDVIEIQKAVALYNNEKIIDWLVIKGK